MKTTLKTYVKNLKKLHIVIYMFLSTFVKKKSKKRRVTFFKKIYKNRRNNICYWFFAVTLCIVTYVTTKLT